MKHVHEALLKLQELDREIRTARGVVEEFDPRLEEIAAPLAALEASAEAARKELDVMTAEVRRLERAAEEKRARQAKYEEHLERARNAREEAAARAELDLVRRAVEADEREALERMEAVTRLELRLDDLGRQLEAARKEADPVRTELMKERDDATGQLAELQERREAETSGMDRRARQLYEQVAGGRSRIVVTSLTADGACGNCYSMIPIQQQSEIRRAGELIRCEACGVILYAEG